MESGAWVDESPDAVDKPRILAVVLAAGKRRRSCDRTLRGGGALLGVGVAAVAAVVATSASGVSTSGTITRIAGSGVRGFSGDGGPAIAARLNYPRGVAVDGKGNVYIADLSNLRIRKVSPSGTITTFAGNGRYGSSGDGGPATSARLYYPYAVAVDRLRNVYIIDGGEDD